MTKIEKTGSVLNHGQKTELLRRWFTESVKGQHRYYMRDLYEKKLRIFFSELD